VVAAAIWFIAAKESRKKVDAVMEQTLAVIRAHIELTPDNRPCQQGQRIKAGIDAIDTRGCPQDFRDAYERLREVLSDLSYQSCLAAQGPGESWPADGQPGSESEIKKVAIRLVDAVTALKRLAVSHGGKHW
jgi:hypothetical protein